MFDGKPWLSDTLTSKDIADQIAELALTVAGGHHKAIRGVGVAFNGATNHHDPDAIWMFESQNAVSSHLPFWLKVALQSKFGQPLEVVFANCSHVAAWGEYQHRQRFSGKKSFSNLVYLTIGSHVGAGIVSNGMLHMGDNGYAGMIGHMLVDYGGTPSNELEACDECGKIGCLSSLASARRIVERYMALTSNQPTGRVQAYASVRDDERGKVDRGYTKPVPPSREGGADQAAGDATVDALSIVRAAETNADGPGDDKAIQVIKEIAQPLGIAVVKSPRS